ncbi:tRNA lysidine(34) synthetase TilS [Aquimarina sp. 2201CG14-23]|uniref:tRNA lysidine(34) synthetase TilS n=1 Tax=Aquimarina mycalae TaxID=3040073 RepID=UPI0024782E69|nr:tRNA lysidine(34) synthetase TilS [Aquimarina sp. 2201CG14-23]MDH7444219.1 tRNA lysidine(34) synthetase TilS [Aquimarina sp. 2201CG14-23]
MKHVLRQIKKTLIEQFKTHIKNHLSFLNESKLLIACSGGLDSMVLTYLCSSLDLEFGIAHCNFKLREAESDGDEKFVSEVSDKLGVACFVTSFETEKYAKKHKISIQMAARTLRYKWFSELLLEYQYDFVLTAHHKDDNLETFLINLSRGTGIEGLTGIPEINDVYVRPLLPFSRNQILEFAKEINISWREDSSNGDTKYLRNKLRHNVIPELTSVNPEFLQNFETTLNHLKQANTFVKNQVDRVRKDVFEYSELDTIKIPIHKLQQYDDPKTYLYFLLKEYGFTAWNDILQILTAQSGKQVFSSTHRLVKNRADLLLCPIIEDISDRIYTIPEEENMIMIPSGMLKFKEVFGISNHDLKTIYVDKEKLKYPLVVRKWKEGDYFYPLGMKGKKKLSKYFKDEKLSLLAKERVWLLCAGEDIVWVINYRADNRFKISPKTKQLLKVTIT